MEVNDRPKIHHPQGTPSITNHTFGSEQHGLLIPFKLSGIFSMFDSRKPTDDDFIDGTPVPITPECEKWNRILDNLSKMRMHTRMLMDR